MPSVASTLALSLLPACAVFALPINTGAITDVLPELGARGLIPESLPVIGGVTETLSRVPLVGNILARDLPLVGELPVAGSLLGRGLIPDGLPVVGGLVKTAEGLPIVGSLLERDLPIVGSLPVVGDLTKSVTGTVANLPVVGGLTKTVAGTVGSLPVVGGILGRDLPIVGNLPAVGAVTNSVDSLPIVGSILKRDLPIVGSLPVVGGLTKTVTGTVSSLPIVGGILGRDVAERDLVGPIFSPSFDASPSANSPLKRGFFDGVTLPLSNVNGVSSPQAINVNQGGDAPSGENKVQTRQLLDKVVDGPALNGLNVLATSQQGSSSLVASNQ